MKEQAKEKNEDLVWGIILIAIGLFVLTARFIELDESLLGLAILPLLGIGFLTWGITTREAGLMIPGGILSGIGLGVVLLNGPFDFLSGDDSGGIFMFSFAFGWVLITITSALFSDETQWWPLIPATIMTLIGLGIFAGGIFWSLLSIISGLWPVGLILIGLYILYQAAQTKSGKLDT